MLGLVGGAPGGETPRVADSSAAGAGRFFHKSVPPSKLNRLGKPSRTMCNVRPFNQLVAEVLLASVKTLERQKPADLVPSDKSVLTTRRGRTTATGASYRQQALICDLSQEIERSGDACAQFAALLHN